MEARLNKFIIFFFLVVTFIVYGAWEVLRSDFVADYISKKLSETLTKQKDLIVSFERLEVSPLSLGVTIKNVFFENPKLGGSIDQIDLDAGIINLFKSKISLNEITINGAELFYDHSLFENSSMLESQGDIKKGEMFSNKNIEKLQLKNKLADLFSHEIFERFKKIRFKNSRFNFRKTQLHVDEFYIHNFREIKILAGTVRFKNDWLESKGLIFDGLKFRSTISRNKISISPIVLKSDIDQLKLKCEIVFNEKGIPVVSGEADANFSLEKLNVLYDLGFKGHLNISGSFGGTLEKIQSKLELSSSQIESNYYRFKQFSSKLGISSKDIFVESLNVRVGDGNLYLNERKKIFSFDSEKINLEKINLKLKNLHTRDFLFFLGPELEIMDLVFDGDIKFNYFDNVISISLDDNFKLKKSLLEQSKSQKILEINNIEIANGSVQVKLHSNETEISLRSKNDDFDIDVSGVISDKVTSFKVYGENVDLRKIGKISGVNIQGKGILDLDIVSDIDTTINMKVDMVDFGIVDFYFGDSKGEASYNVSNGIIDIKRLVSLIRESKGHISGSYDLGKSILELDGQHHQANVHDLFKMFGAYIDLPVGLRQKIDGKLNSRYKIKGPLDPNAIKINGFVKSTLLNLDEIFFKELFCNVIFENGRIKVPQLSTGLFGGKFQARYEYHLGNNYQDIDFSLTGASTSGLPYLPKFTTPIKGDINIEGYGTGTPADFKLKIGTDVQNLNVANQLYKDNFIDFIWDVDTLLIDLDFFNSQMITKSLLNFGNDSKRKSFLKSSFNFKSLNPFFYTINTNLKSRQSSLKSRFSANFEVIADLSNQLVESIDLDITDFYLRHYTNTLVIKRGRNKIEYRDGLIKKGQLQFIGSNKFINYDLSKIDNLVFTNKFLVKLPLTYLELIVPKTEFNEGSINGHVEYLTGALNSFTKGAFYFKGLSFQTRNVPVSFNDLNGEIILKNRSFLIKNVRGEIGKGNFKAEGYVSLDEIVPALDLRFSLDNSLIMPFDNSKFLLSADGAIRGTELPYLVDGKIIVYRSEINESIDKLTMQAGPDGSKTKSRYLPQLKINAQSKLVRTDFDIDFIKPLKITNDLFSLNLIGGGTILGDFDEVKFDGKFQTKQDEENIIIIKGHRFAIDNGVVTLKEDNNDSNLNIKGTTKIKDYDINLAVEGPLKKISVSLTSEPQLAKEDIFSLITFGYTTQTSQELDQEDRNSVATVGIGSMIFDQLKIGQGLSSSLGLKMSIAPEFQTEDGSLLDGKSGTSTARRLRSATRIKVEKSFSDKVDMSFSNTVGGTVQQKQQMNVIYKVNDNVSLDGVLEVNDVQEESSESPESVGADLKYKWSF